MAAIAQRPEVSWVVETTAIRKFYDVIDIRCPLTTQNTLPLVPATDSAADVTPIHQFQNGLLAIFAAPR